MDPFTQQAIADAAEFAGGLGRLVHTLGYQLPLAVLLLTAALAGWLRARGGARLVGYVGYLGLIACALALAAGQERLLAAGVARAVVAEGLLVVDFAGTFHGLLLVVIAAAGIALIQDSSTRSASPEGGTRDLCLLLAIGGGLLVVGAADLVSLWLGLELMTAPTVLLLLRGGALAREAAAKLLMTHALASALMLFGMTLLYGLAGSTEIGKLVESLVAGLRPAGATGGSSLALMVPALLVLCALATKLAVFPAHFVVGDVAQAAGRPAMLLVLAAFPLAGVAAAQRLFGPLTQEAEGPLTLLPGLARGLSAPWGGLIQLAAATTLLLGGLAAHSAVTLERLLAAVAVLHGGLLLAALSAMPGGGAAAASGCAAAFVLAMLAALALLPERGVRGATSPRPELRGRAGNPLTAWNGLLRRSPAAGVALLVALIGLAGLPPSAAFAGRVHAAGVVVESGAGWLVAFALVAMAAVLYPLGRLAWGVAVGEPDKGAPAHDPSPLATVIALAAGAPTLLWLAFPEALVAAAQAFGR